jgi:hypothetical protein
MDAAVFFGRDAQLVRALDEFRQMRRFGETQMFVILGPSGAGKSSFLRAGLLPRLRRDDRNFAVLGVVRPERRALTGETGLAQSLHHASRRLGINAPSVGEIKQACLGDLDRVRELLSDIQATAAARLLWLPEGASPPALVLPVDQAEELFSVDAGPEAQRFLEMIGEFADGDVEHSVPLIVAITIRTDRYEVLQTAPQLSSMKSVIFDDLKPLPLAEFRQVIEGPARRATEGGRPLRIDPALVERLLNDCAGGADTLPLLSLTLARLYMDYGGDGDLTLHEYESMGAMGNVAQTEVDNLLSSDPVTRGEQLGLLREAFIPALATINPDNDQPMRRVARWDELPAESLPLLEKFVDSRLLVRDDRAGGNVVEIALESLFRHWDELREWLEDERENMRSAEVLRRDASEWNRNDGDDAWLLQGTRLANAEELLERARFGDYLSSTREFVEASRRRESPRRRFNLGNWIRRNR